MSIGRHHMFGARVAVVVFAVAAGTGCYRPNIVDGGLRCADGGVGPDGGVCPDGFFCGANGLCKKGSAPVCTATLPHVAQICEPDPGTDCDPICQSRCECGRCNLLATNLGCTPPGDKQRGQLCNPLADDCAPGNICLRDCRGLIARCFRYCGYAASFKEAVCDGQSCDIVVNDLADQPTELTVCQPPFRMCNPVATNSTECGEDLGCYVSDRGGMTVCECRGTKMPNEECTVFNSCIPGYRCVMLGTAAPVCLKTCTVGVGSDCPSGFCTSAGGGGYGYCAP